MTLPFELLAVVGATTLAAQPARRDLADRRLTAGVQGQLKVRTVLTLALLVVVSVVCGITLSVSEGMRGVYALGSLIAVIAAGLAFPYVALRAPMWIVIAAGVAAGSLYTAGFALAPLHLLLIVAAALGAACLVSLAFGARGCALLLLGMVACDLVMWQAGILEKFQFAGIGTIELHPLAAVPLGDFTLGSGDVLASALLGTWAYSYLPVAGRLLVVSVQLTAMTAMIAWAMSSGATLPATLPSLAALTTGAVFVLVRRKALRSVPA